MTLEKMFVQPLDKKFLLPIRLQQFADGEGDDNTPDLSGEAELAAAIKTLLDSETKEDDSDDEEDIDEEETDDEDVDDAEDEELDEELDEEELEEDEEELEEEDTKKQNKAKNAKFAQQRRERELKEKVDAELERLKQESPEFKLAQMLSETYNQPVEAIMEQIKEEQLNREAQAQKVPVEVLRKQRAESERADRLEQEIGMLKFQNWQTQIKADGDKLMSDYKMLTQKDIDAATNYILNVAKNVEIPLEDAVFAVHGKKIVESLAKGKVQDELANQSGRKKKTPLSPNNGKAPKVVSLTADEKTMARAFGMTDEEYIKFKS